MSPNFSSCKFVAKSSLHACLQDDCKAAPVTVAAQMMGLLAGAGAAATSVEAHALTHCCSKIFQKHATSCDDRICTVSHLVSLCKYQITMIVK